MCRSTEEEEEEFFYYFIILLFFIIIIKKVIITNYLPEVITRLFASIQFFCEFIG